MVTTTSSLTPSSVRSLFWDYFGALDDREKQLNYASHQHHIIGTDDDAVQTDLLPITTFSPHPPSHAYHSPVGSGSTPPPPGSSHSRSASGMAQRTEGRSPPPPSATASASASVVSPPPPSSSIRSRFEKHFLGSFTRKRPLIRLFDYTVLVVLALYTGFYMCGTVRDIGLQHIDQCYAHGSDKMISGVSVIEKKQAKAKGGPEPDATTRSATSSSSTGTAADAAADVRLHDEQNQITNVIHVHYEEMPLTSRLIKLIFFDSGVMAMAATLGTELGMFGHHSDSTLTTVAATSLTSTASSISSSSNPFPSSASVPAPSEDVAADAFTFIGYDDWDAQWRNFNQNIPLLTIGLSVYVLISRWLYSRFNNYADYADADGDGAACSSASSESPSASAPLWAPSSSSKNGKRTSRRRLHNLHLYGLLVLNVGFVVGIQSTGAIFTLGIAFLNYKVAQAVINWVDRKNVHYHSHNNKKTSASTSQPPPPPALINLALAQVVSIVLHVGFLVVVRKYGGLSFVDLVGKRIAFASLASSGPSASSSWNPFAISFWEGLDYEMHHAMMHWHSSYALVMLKMLAYNYDMWYCFNYFRHHQYQKFQPSTQKSTQLKPGERKPYTMSNYANDAECKKIFLDHYTTFMGRAPATEAEEQRCHDIYVSIIAESRLHENAELLPEFSEQRNDYPGVGKGEQKLFEPMASSVDFWSLRRRTECPRFNNKFAHPAGADDEGADDYGLKQYVLFCCYLPLFIAGPAMGYNAFVSQCLYRPQKTYFFNFSKQMAALRTRFGFNTPASTSETSGYPVSGNKDPRHNFLIVYAVGIVCLYVILLLFLHVVPMNCIRYNDEIFNAIGGIDLQSQVAQYYQVIWVTLLFMWLKFTVIWRFFRFFSILDGVEVVEDMLSFHLNTRGVADFWRNWHHSFNAWIVRYIYVPSGGAKKKHLNVFPIFLFMALWHETELYMFMWAAVNCSFMVVELMADGWAKKTVNKFYMTTYFKRYARWMLSPIESPMMSSASPVNTARTQAVKQEKTLIAERVIKVNLKNLKDFSYSQNIWWWQYARTVGCSMIGSSMFFSNMFGFATGNNSNRIITGAFFLPFYAEKVGEVGTFEFVGFNFSGFIVAISPILYGCICAGLSHIHKEHLERRQEREKWQLCQRFVVHNT